MRSKREVGEFEHAGKQIFCAHCGTSQFEKGEAQLNTPGLTLLGLDWANRTATVLACARCSRIDLMKKLHVRAPETVLAQAGVEIPLAYPLFIVVEGPKASWERGKG